MRNGFVLILAGVIALAGAGVAAGLGMAEHDFTDVKTWFAVALAAAVVGVALLTVGRRLLRRPA